MSTTAKPLGRIRTLAELVRYRLLMTRCRHCGWSHPTLLGHIYGLEGRLPRHGHRG